ncbi:Trigger factor [Syntrophobacter sp. SbD1]|nr:Trigger factor [Syntrophobacter sp. SbD1]
MNVSLTDISPSQKKIRVEIPESRVAKEFDKKYRDLAKNSKIKGFRPGKVPLSILKSYYGKAVEHEVSSQFIQDTFGDALKEVDLKPLTQADISESHFDEGGSFTYTALVDVCPPFEMPDYKGLKLFKPAVQVTEEQLLSELDKLAQSHAQLRAIEIERPVQDADVAIVDFTPSIEGRVFEKGKTSDFMAEIGKNALHPEFDKHLLGRKPGESFSFELDYPEDASTPELAGKRVLFDLTIKELKEKEVPELNDEFALSLGTGQFETLEALRAEIRGKLLEREEQKASQTARDQILEKILAKVSFELSPKVIEREAEKILQNLKHQFEAQGLKIGTDAFDAPEYKTGTMLQAEKDIRTRLVLEKIAEAEAITLDAEEEEQVFRDIAAAFRIDLVKVKMEYGESAIVEQEKERKINDKVLKFIENEAVFVDTPEEAIEPEAESGAEGQEQISDN